MKLFIKYLINILIDVYRIFNFRKSHGSFLGVYKNFEEASKKFSGINFGYKLIDEWKSEEQCIIPFHRNVSVTKYSGFYFKKI